MFLKRILKPSTKPLIVSLSASYILFLSFWVTFSTSHLRQGREPPFEHPCTKLSGVSGFGRGQPLRENFEPNRNCCPSRPISKKKYCPCILEGRLITNVILIALHFQGPKFIIFICSLPLSKYAIDWDFIIKAKPSIKHVIDLEVKNITKPSLASTEVIVFVTYDLKLSL